jgi:AmmeMemoRadiSam system protein B
MAGPKRGLLAVRPPAVAGTFYPAEPVACRALAEEYVKITREAIGVFNREANSWIGGVVPHAGWICSGEIAGQTIGALWASVSQFRCPLDVVVVFGAVHSSVPLGIAALDPHAAWAVPGGESPLPEELERRLIESSANLFVVDEQFHRREHAVEVELPLIRAAWPDAAVLPVEVPPVASAADIGIATARQLEEAGLTAVFLASSDLTHYGPAYRFTPAGVGLGGLAWARDNDRRLLDRVTRLAVDEVVPQSLDRLNACGSGAIAAMLAACRERGATHGQVLRHANSFETLAGLANAPGPDNAVGYAAVVVG